MDRIFIDPFLGNGKSIPISSLWTLTGCFSIQRSHLVKSSFVFFEDDIDKLPFPPSIDVGILLNGTFHTISSSLYVVLMEP